MFIRAIKAYKTENKQIRLGILKKYPSSNENYKEDNESAEFYDEKNAERLRLKDHSFSDPRLTSLNSDSHMIITKREREEQLGLSSKSNKINLKRRLLESDDNNDCNAVLFHSGEQAKQTNDTSRSDIISFALSQMRYFENDDSDYEENIELIEKIKKTVIFSKGRFIANSDPLNIKDKEELEEIKHLIENKIKKRNQKCRAELSEIYRTESNHFGIKSIFVFTSFAILMLNILLRGQTQKSVFGIRQ